MKCIECRFCILQDEGYSNWTVEGQSADCLLSLNPHFPDDTFYGQASSLLFAEKCPSFAKGDPVLVDVDQEKGDLVNYSDDENIKTLLVRYQND